MAADYIMLVAVAHLALFGVVWRWVQHSFSTVAAKRLDDRGIAAIGRDTGPTAGKSVFGQRGG